MVKELNRSQIENLIQEFEVINSQIIQDKNTLDIVLILANNRKCIIKYSLEDQTKSYFSN